MQNSFYKNDYRNKDSSQASWVKYKVLICQL